MTSSTRPTHMTPTTTQTAPQSEAPAFPGQHVGPLQPCEWRALLELHSAAPRPLSLLGVLKICEPMKGTAYEGLLHLQMRGWVRTLNGFALAFTARGLREAPDRQACEAVELPPLPVRWTPPPEGDISQVDPMRMGTLLVVLGGSALHRPSEFPSIVDRDLKIFSDLLHLTQSHGFDAVHELFREIADSGETLRAVKLAVDACLTIPPDEYADVLRPYGMAWLLTAAAPEHVIH